jgi:hypothetical protein
MTKELKAAAAATTMTADELEARICAAGHSITLAGLVRERVAAEVLGVAPRTLRKWRTLGKPPEFTQLNGAVWYSVADLALAVGPERPFEALCGPDAPAVGGDSGEPQQPDGARRHD